jgi:hypothetical protein
LLRVSTDPLAHVVEELPEVDLNTPQFLSRHFRDEVLAEAEDQYAA